MNEETRSPDGPTLEIPDVAAKLQLQAKVGRMFNMALLAAAQHDCNCYACSYLNHIAELSMNDAAAEVGRPPPASAPPPPAAAAPAATELGQELPSAPASGPPVAAATGSPSDAGNGPNT